MSGAPMSDEQRAALEQRLAQLRAAQASGGAAPAQPSPNGAATGAPHGQHADPQHHQQRHAAAASRPAPQMGYGYDDDDDEEGEEEEVFDAARQQFEDEFLSMIAAQQQRLQQQQQRPVAMHERNAASVAQVNATRHADDGVDVVATDKTAQRTRELGDFEALRLAKMGDMASMLGFGTACGVDWKTFVDNHGRNVLHYAADAGAAPLIRKITDMLRVPYVADEKRLTPLDIAVLNGHVDVETDDVFAALVAAAAAARHADAALADPKVVKTLDSVLQAHAPAPPKFVMSKPVPKPSEATGARTFWQSSNGAAASAGAATPSSVQCSSGADMSEAERAEVAAAVQALDQHGRLEWLRPVSRDSSRPCERWVIARAVSASAEKAQTTTADTTTGIVVAQVLAESTLKGAAAQKIKKTGDGPVKVAVAAHLAVRGTARRTGVAASLLRALRQRIQAETADTANAIVFFAAAAQIPRPPTPVATVKWYRRVFEPVQVYASDSSYDVFPDFYTYDAVLRADAVLKGAIPQSLSQQYAAQMPSWCDVDVSSEEQGALLLSFIQDKAGTAASNVDLACVPQGVEELRRSYLDRPDHRAFVRADAQGNLTDLVVFRRHDARKARDGAGSRPDEGTFAAEVVYALFTDLAGTVKVDHMMLLSSKLLAAKLLLVPTLFGITESDLAKSNFDEVVANREFVYAVSPSTLKEVDGLGTIPAAKLSLPLYSI